MGSDPRTQKLNECKAIAAQQVRAIQQVYLAKGWLFFTSMDKPKHIHQLWQLEARMSHRLVWLI